MGFSANPLTLGCDCLGEIFYFDGTVNDSSGNAVTIPNAICMH
jgi:primary-amine oxidase